MTPEVGRNAGGEPVRSDPRGTARDVVGARAADLAQNCIGQAPVGHCRRIDAQPQDGQRLPCAGAGETQTEQQRRTDGLRHSQRIWSKPRRLVSGWKIHIKGPRSISAKNGWSSSGNVTAMPISPTTRVIGKPTAKMFICGATRDTIPSARLTNISMPTIGKAIHKALANKSAPRSCRFMRCNRLQKVLINRKLLKTPNDRHKAPQVSVHHHKQQSRHLPKEARHGTGLRVG